MDAESSEIHAMRLSSEALLLGEQDTYCPVRSHWIPLKSGPSSDPSKTLLVVRDLLASIPCVGESVIGSVSQLVIHKSVCNYSRNYTAGNIPNTGLATKILMDQQPKHWARSTPHDKS